MNCIEVVGQSLSDQYTSNALDYEGVRYTNAVFTVAGLDTSTAATIDGTETDLTTPLPAGSTVSIITSDTDEGRHVLRHSTAHVLAQAVTRLFPGAKFTIGPAIENGFYYDFDLPDGKTFTDDDLATIEQEMREMDSLLSSQVQQKLLAAQERNKNLREQLRHIQKEAYRNQPGHCDCCDGCLTPGQDASSADAAAAGGSAAHAAH